MTNNNQEIKKMSFKDGYLLHIAVTVDELLEKVKKQDKVIDSLLSAVKTQHEINKKLLEIQSLS